MLEGAEADEGCHLLPSNDHPSETSASGVDASQYSAGVANTANVDPKSTSHTRAARSNLWDLIKGLGP